jgi:RHS repeat-associated protein
MLESGDEHTFQYDQSGRHLEAATKKDRVEFGYDGLGNLIFEKRNGLGVEHRFEGWRNPAESTFFARFIVRYKWSAGNTLVITDPGGKSHQIRFYGHGLLERRFSNGSNEVAQYDNQGRCLVKCAERRNGQVWGRRYQWSGEGELQRVEDRIRGDVRYQYDSAHRLRRRFIAGRVEDYEMDLAGNLLRQPGLPQVTHQSGNRLNTVNGHTITYNDRDHIETRAFPNGTIRYLYDSRDQLIGVEGLDAPWNAEYDAFNRRTRKTWGGKTTEYYWNGDQLIAEVAAEGRLRIYLYADPLALTPLLFLDYDTAAAPVDSCRRYFVFTDQIGTPCSVEDDSGAEVWRAWVDPFGRAEVGSGASIECTLRFPGHCFDAELGLHYNRFRHYDPLLGRYLQSDPWGVSGGYNLYAYRLNPLLEVDVRGLGEEEQKKGKPCPDEEDNRPLDERKGWVDEYGEQKKVTGDGSVDRDHQPSKAAIKKAIKEDIDRRVAAGEMSPPTEEQMKAINNRIDKEAQAVVVDHDVHKEGPTHGNKNKAQSDIDKQDLGAAAARDADAMVANAAKHDPDNLPAYQAAADKIKQQTHEGIMDKNRKIVDDVMKSGD